MRWCRRTTAPASGPSPRKITSCQPWALAVEARACSPNLAPMVLPRLRFSLASPCSLALSYSSFNGFGCPSSSNQPPAVRKPYCEKFWPNAIQLPVTKCSPNRISKSWPMRLRDGMCAWISGRNKKRAPRVNLPDLRSWRSLNVRREFRDSDRQALEPSLSRPSMPLLRLARFRHWRAGPPVF